MNEDVYEVDAWNLQLGQVRLKVPCALSAPSRKQMRALQHGTHAYKCLYIFTSAAMPVVACVACVAAHDMIGFSPGTGQ